MTFLIRVASKKAAKEARRASCYHLMSLYHGIWEIVVWLFSLPENGDPKCRIFVYAYLQGCELEGAMVLTSTCMLK